MDFLPVGSSASGSANAPTVLKHSMQIGDALQGGSTDPYSCLR
jgi:hypothetical protein